MISKDKLSALEQELNGDIQKGYLKCFEEGRIDKAIKLKEVSGVGLLKKFRWIKPIIDEKMEEAVQKGYTECLERSWIDRARQLKKFTGIEPSEKTIHEAYLTCFEYGWPGSAYDIKKFTGISPNKEIAEKYPDVYKKFLGEQK